jgi:hypothetical protein
VTCRVVRRSGFAREHDNVNIDTAAHNPRQQRSEVRTDSARVLRSSRVLCQPNEPALGSDRRSQGASGAPPDAVSSSVSASCVDWSSPGSLPESPGLFRCCVIGIPYVEDADAGQPLASDRLALPEKGRHACLCCSRAGSASFTNARRLGQQNEQGQQYAEHHCSGNVTKSRVDGGAPPQRQHRPSFEDALRAV